MQPVQLSLSTAKNPKSLPRNLSFKKESLFFSRKRTGFPIGNCSRFIMMRSPSDELGFILATLQFRGKKSMASLLCFKVSGRHVRQVAFSIDCGPIKKLSFAPEAGGKRLRCGVEEISPKRVTSQKVCELEYSRGCAFLFRSGATRRTLTPFNNL